MSRVISTNILRTQLNNLLDELGRGETHFIIERHDEPAAVLLSVEKFQEIMQMLEMLNSLDYIPTDELDDDNFALLAPTPNLTSLAGGQENMLDEDEQGQKPKSFKEEAARLGIRIVK